jgi:hypothetical protein
LEPFTNGEKSERGVLMKTTNLTAALALAAIALVNTSAAAQSGKPRLHVNPRWSVDASVQDGHR